MTTLPRGQDSEDKRIAVIVRIPGRLDHDIEVACSAMGWKKQHFFEVAARNLLVKLAGRRMQ